MFLGYVPKNYIKFFTSNFFNLEDEDIITKEKCIIIKQQVKVDYKKARNSQLFFMFLKIIIKKLEIKKYYTIKLMFHIK